MPKEIYCGKCGSRLDPATGLCPKCQSEQFLEENINKEDPKKSSDILEIKETRFTKKQKVLIGVLAAIIILLAIVFGLLVSGVLNFSSDSSSAEQTVEKPLYSRTVPSETEEFTAMTKFRPTVRDTNNNPTTEKTTKKSTATKTTTEKTTKSTTKKTTKKTTTTTKKKTTTTKKTTARQSKIGDDRAYSIATNYWSPMPDDYLVVYSGESTYQGEPVYEFTLYEVAEDEESINYLWIDNISVNAYTGEVN